MLRTAISESSPKVSVVIPSYNTGRWIQSALKSVLDTRYSNIEIVVVDDGSTDNSLEVIHQFILQNPAANIKVYTHRKGKNKGIALTRNLGILRSNGKYVCFLDADDIFLPIRFDNCVPLLEQEDDLEAVLEPFEFALLSGKRAEVMRSDDMVHEPGVTIRAVLFPKEEKFVIEALRGKLVVHTSSITIRKNAFRHTGMFPNLKYCLEPPLLFKLMARERVRYGSQLPVSRYYIHDHSTIAKNEAKADFSFDTIRSLINTFSWMKRNQIRDEYVDAFRKQIIGKWYYYSTNVLHKPHSFTKDVILAMIQVGLAVPDILFQTKFWKSCAILILRKLNIRKQ